MLDLFQQVREELKLNVVRDGSLIKPLVYEESGTTLCYNSGGRGVVFPYNGRAKRVKGIVDPTGRLTERVGHSTKNKIEDIQRFAENKPYAGVNGKPFAVLTREAAEREKRASDRLNWRYWNAGLKAPYAVEDVVATGRTFSDDMTFQLYLDLPRVENDLRVEEFNSLLRDLLGNLSAKEIKEREGDVVKLYHRFMQWHGFSIRCLAESKLLPTMQSFVPQNYVISRVRGGYGLFRVDHTSTETREDTDEKVIAEELIRRSTAEQSDGPISTFGALPTAVLLAANHSDQVPKDSRPLFERCHYFRGKFTAGDRYVQALNIFYIQFINGIRTPEPEPIEEGFFRRVLM